MGRISGSRSQAQVIWRRQRDSLAAVARQAIRPPQQLSGSEWAARNVVLPDTDPFPGRFSYERTPFAREIADACTDANVRRVTVIAATQLLKTTIAFNRLGWGIEHREGAKLYVMASKEHAKELVDERLKPFLESCPATNRLRTQGQGSWTERRLKFNTGTIFIAGSNSRMDAKSKTVVDLILDEVAAFKTERPTDAGALALFFDRITAVPEPFVLIVSSPIYREDPAWKSYLTGTRERWEVPCPHCGEYECLDFWQIKWKTANARTARAEARYECVRCAGVIRDEHRWDMQQQGRWVAERPGGSHRSFLVNKLNSLNVRQISWGYFAEKFLSCYPMDGDGNKIADSAAYPEDLQGFFNGDLCRLWEQPGEAMEQEDLESLKDQSYSRGACPIADPAAVILTVDVQKLGLKWEIDAWGPHETSYLVDYGYERFAFTASGKPKFDLALAVPLARRIITGPAGETIGITHRLIDSGDETEAVYAFCRAQRWQATKGERTEGGVDVWRWGQAKDSRVRLVLFQSNKFKDRLAQRWQIPLDSPGSWHLPRDVGSDYLREITGERRLDEPAAGGVSWLPIKGRRHDWKDARVLQEVACVVLGLRDRSTRAASSAEPAVAQRLTTEDGRPFFVLER